MESLKIIKKIPFIHCAKGPDACEECSIAQAKGLSFALIRVYLRERTSARPTTEVYVGCRRVVGEYDIIKRFKSKDDAKKYAIKHRIEITFD